MKVSKRADVAPFFAMEILKHANERAARGEAVFHLEAGEPGTGAPAGVMAAAREALEDAHLGYTESQGMLALRERIQQHYQEVYGRKVSSERIFITMGASGGLILAFIAAFDVGDRVVLAEPSYPAYRNTLKSLGVEVVSLPTDATTRFQPTVELLQTLDQRPDGLVIASPSNPSGTIIPRDEFAAVAAYCEANDIRLISDEIYHGITYGEPAETALAFTETAVIASGFSKYFAMTGWRLGWIVMPNDLTLAAERLAQNLFVSPPAISQHAALAAFDCRDELDENVRRYARNREILQTRLPAAGFGDLAPCDGAFYAYADVSSLTNDSEEFCKNMLAETGVAATPGIDFDQRQGRRYVRFSFAGSTEDVETACDAIEGWLGKSGNTQQG